LGWDGTKTPYNRDMLSALKEFYTEWFDGPFKEMIEVICKEHNIYARNRYLNRKINDAADFIIFHVREPKEISRVKEWCNTHDIECYTICIVANDVETVHNNSADNDVMKYKYDFTIYNNKRDGDIETFKNDIYAVLKTLHE